ncbi:Integrator complex subunit 3 [Trichinella pseudospiralis]|uniref:SOSS complex subunit A homolog n=1 Tax=Trichinella pseudospiralis TaxID=6337 RepID=A0A0V1G5A1_TRIPS|nr:Integrator complex subunit 3 [Trichinella pseudospiralis]
MTSAESKVESQKNLSKLSRGEAKCETECRLEQCYYKLTLDFHKFTCDEIDAHTIGAVGCETVEELSLGLLFGILIEPDRAAGYFRNLITLNQDGMPCVINSLLPLIGETFNKCTESVRKQIVWLFRELAKVNCQGVDIVCQLLLRQCSAGDLSCKNLWLADSLVDFFSAQFSWLEKNPAVIGFVIYKFLRLIRDHQADAHRALLERETNLCVKLLRDHMLHCAVVGRDLVRLLISVGGFAPFKLIFQEMISNPSCFGSSFGGLQQLLQQRTSRRFHASLITCDLESKLKFMLSQVRMNDYQQFLLWLDAHYFSKPEQASLRQDVIRFICTCIYPTNEVINSTIIQRWYFISQLISTCPVPLETIFCKLALYYDWLFFNPESESVMLLEPAILMARNFLPSQPEQAFSILEFLALTAYEFYPPMRQQILACVRGSFRKIISDHVLPSMDVFFALPNWDEKAKQKVWNLCHDDIPTSVKLQNTEIQRMTTGVDEQDEMQQQQQQLVNIESKQCRSEEDWEAVKLNRLLGQLDPKLRVCVKKLSEVRTESSSSCKAMVDLLMAMFQLEKFDQEQATLLAECLCLLFKMFFAHRLLPDNLSNFEQQQQLLQQHQQQQDYSDDNFNEPLFMIFRNLCLTPEDDPSRKPLLLLLAKMYEKQQRLGYFFLYFLQYNGSTIKSKTMTPYKDLAKLVGNSLDEMLEQDLKICARDDYRLFFLLLPHVYKACPEVSLRSTEIIHLVAAYFDGVILYDFLVQMNELELQLFRKDTFPSVLQASLEWSTMEQMCFWNLVSADGVPIEWIQHTIPKLEYPKHVEAMINICLMLGQLKREPGKVLVRQLLSSSEHRFAVNGLKKLMVEYENRTADLVAQILCSTVVDTGTKAKRHQAKAPSQEQILAHLDHFRCSTSSCDSFFSKEPIQAALNTVKARCSQALRVQFNDLFSISDILDSVRDGRSLRRRSVPVSRTKVNDSSDDDAGSYVLAKNAKKRGRQSTVGSDSE